MTEPMHAGVYSRTQEQLRILTLAHYVVGAIHAAIACFGLLHFGMGIWMLCSPQLSSSESETLRILTGSAFAFIGGLFVVGGWALGVATILSGYYISRRKRRNFSLLLAGVNCVFIPFGTILGIFDFLLLTREDVLAEYGLKVADRSVG